MAYNFKKIKKINVNIYNLSKEGILDAYPYKSFDDATIQK